MILRFEINIKYSGVIRLVNFNFMSYKKYKKNLKHSFKDIEDIKNGYKLLSYSFHYPYGLIMNSNSIVTNQTYYVDIEKYSFGTNNIIDKIIKPILRDYKIKKIINV
jgi:hypothetical protein